MSFATSTTYIYAYIAFASVYLIASITFGASALRVSARLSRARRAEPAEPTTAASVAGSGAVIARGQRIVDYTQLATLLPLVYIVGSLFLGSVLARDTNLARAVNVGWIAFTAICGIASVGLAVLGIRESGAISRSADLPHGLNDRTSEAIQRIGTRLGVSVALLLLVTVFTMLNLWSIVSSVNVLSTVDFLL